ncbi:hypothetical protein NEDG_00637 [Nematocida displodere]|uniref:Kinetochore protein Spc24 n=1 Tax=Nematocida displodere TaxID=1805483 RepID=A0A177EC28_9MICR|nr:hypothetical protein NEDG_00637 [Nematocida displodere]
MDARTDALLKEIHEKDSRLSEAHVLLRSTKSKISTLTAQLEEAQKTLEEKDSIIRHLQKKLKHNDQAVIEAEKQCMARIKRESHLKRSHELDKDHKILMLEWIIREVGTAYNLPAAHILVLSNICDEGDTLIWQLIQPSNPSTPDLIEQLDNNGIKNVFDGM